VQPFYLITVTGYEETAANPTPLEIALCPLFSYTTSLIFSLFFYKPMVKMFKNRFYPLFLSIIIITIGSLPLLVFLKLKI
jgi:hypothetical protein